MRNELAARLIAVIVFCIPLVCGCGGNQDETAIVGGAGPVVTAPAGGSLEQFPAPGSYAGLLSAPRFASYQESDLIKPGIDYTTGMPDQNVAPSGFGAEFHTTWPADGLAGLGYCFFEFQVQGYDRPAEINYGWNVPPAVISEAYIGLANWTLDRWDWYACTSAGAVHLASMDDYTTGPTEAMLIAVVVAATGQSELRYLRIGPPQVSAQLGSIPTQGIQPFTAEFRGGSSSCPLGPITQYEWDLDGDGLYEDGGPADTANRLIDSAGVTTTRLRVTNSFGETAVDSLDIKAYDPWQHSWGGQYSEYFWDISTDSSGNVYVAGGTESYYEDPGYSDLLVMKYGPDGSLAWARRWAGSNDDLAESIAVTGAGDVFTAGNTSSFGAGLSDFLVQRWSASGDLIWSKTWGGSYSDVAKAVTLRGGALYVVGKTFSFTDSLGDAVVVKYDLDGNVIWSKTFGGSTTDEAEAITTYYNFFSMETAIYITGVSDSFSTSKGVFFTEFDPEGVNNQFQTWAWPESAFAESITTGGFLGTDVFICGALSNQGEVEGFLLEADSGAPLAKLWDAGLGSERFEDLIFTGGKIYLAGKSSSFGDTDSDAILMKMSDTGAAESLRLFQTPGTSSESFQAMRLFPQSGLAFAGHCVAVTESAWQPESVNLSPFPGNWQNQAILVESVSASEGSPAGVVSDLTDGVSDTGGGWDDALVAVISMP